MHGRIEIIAGSERHSRSKVQGERKNHQGHLESENVDICDMLSVATRSFLSHKILPSPGDMYQRLKLGIND